MTHIQNSAGASASVQPSLNHFATPTLSRFSVTRAAEELEKIAQEQTPLLGSICLKSQTTILYAKPNVGKTLITLHLLREAVIQGRISGPDCFYIAADDNPSGVLEKVRLLEPHGVEVLAPSLRGFNAKLLPTHIEGMIEDGSARGRLLILDTLKKFANLMDKRESSGFADLARRFVMRGGSVIGLAHTNKRTDKDGRPIFGGTSDIIDDFDCAYTIMEIQQRSNPTERVVQFDCLKSRGDVAQQVAFGYSITQGQTYAERLASVREKGKDELGHIQAGANGLKYDYILDAIEEQIRKGVHGKMKIAQEVGKLTKTGRQTVCDLIDKYDGDDRRLHRWASIPFDRGERRYQILEAADLY